MVVKTERKKKMKKAIQLTSAMNNAIIILDREDVKGLQDVSVDNNKGNAKVFTGHIGNFYVTETVEQVSKMVFSEVLEVL